MRGVPSSAGAERAERRRRREEGRRAQPDESPRQVLRRKSHAVWDSPGRHGDPAQVNVNFREKYPKMKNIFTLRGACEAFFCRR